MAQQEESPPPKRSKMVVLDGPEAESNMDEHSKRRIIRSHYRQIENRISEHKDELAKPTSKKFLAILNEVDNIHQHLTRPREQVSDAETLLGLVNTFATAVKASTNEGVTAAEFISCLINQFTKSRPGVARDATDISWHDFGSFVSPFLTEAPRCMTMAGPMDLEVKVRKPYTRVKRTNPVGNARPEKIEKTNEAETDTDRNMMVMFDILKKKYRNKVKVQLENLILNKTSFAQTVENLFALSFLVHRGSVKISVDEDGSHVVVPANPPTNEQIVKGEAKVHQFIFRLDFQDWKLMKNLVVDGEELMLQRNVNTTSCYSQAKANASRGQDRAVSNDEDVNIPQAIPIKSPGQGQAKAGLENVHVNIPEAIPVKSPHRTQDKAGLDHVHVNIPKAIPVNSPLRGRSKAGLNHGHVNIPKAIPVKSPLHGRASTRSNEEDVIIPQAIPVNSPTSSVVEAVPISYAFPV